MSTPYELKETKPSSYGSPNDWATLIAGISQGTGMGMQAGEARAQSRRELKENRRRNLANLLNQALAHNQYLFRSKQDYNNQIKDYESQAMQEVARNFVNALKGIPRG